MRRGAVTPVDHVEDVTNTCVRCGHDFVDDDVTILDGVGPVCNNCWTDTDEMVFHGIIALELDGDYGTPGTCGRCHKDAQVRSYSLEIVDRERNLPTHAESVSLCLDCHRAVHSAMHNILK